jgi:hypothetical protein
MSEEKQERLNLILIIGINVLIWLTIYRVIQ